MIEKDYKNSKECKQNEIDKLNNIIKNKNKNIEILYKDFNEVKHN